MKTIQCYLQIPIPYFLQIKSTSSTFLRKTNMDPRTRFSKNFKKKLQGYNGIFPNLLLFDGLFKGVSINLNVIICNQLLLNTHKWLVLPALDGLNMTRSTGALLKCDLFSCVWLSLSWLLPWVTDRKEIKAERLRQTINGMYCFQSIEAKTLWSITKWNRLE